MSAASKGLVSVKPQLPGWAAGTALAPLALVSGIGTVFASSCCVMPLVLAGLGAGSATFSFLSALASYRLPLLIVGGLILALGWLVYFRKKPNNCEASSCVPVRRAIATPVTLTLSTVLLAAGVGFSFVEPTLLALIQ
jgi:mercuric ion transport protein